MSLSLSLALIAIALFVIAFLTNKINVILRDRDENIQSINLKPIAILIGVIILTFIQPYNWEKIEVGQKGLLINLLGDQRGASKTEEVSGIIFYNKYSQEVQEIPLDQRNVFYDKMELVAKGGYPIVANPSFSINVKEAGAAEMFTNLRTYYKNGGLENVSRGWMFVQVNSIINGVINKYGVEYFFNNIVSVEQEIQVNMNKKIGNWFTIQSFKLNAAPPKNILTSITNKAKADAEAITAEAQAKVATADARRKIELAKGDSAAVVINASSEAKAIQLRQSQITPQYIEYIKAKNWDGKMPSTVLGSGSNTMLNLR